MKLDKINYLIGRLSPQKISLVGSKLQIDYYQRNFGVVPGFFCSDFRLVNSVQSWSNRLSHLAGFYASQCRISYKIYSEPLKHTSSSLLMAFAFLFEFLSRQCERKSLFNLIPLTFFQDHIFQSFHVFMVFIFHLVNCSHYLELYQLNQIHSSKDVENHPKRACT